jgi:DNA-binding NarL/FixJ family response regulator
MSRRENPTRKDVLTRLTAAEIAALEAMASADSHAEAVRRLGLSAKTMKTRFASIRDKLGASSTRVAVAMWRGEPAA